MGFLSIPILFHIKLGNFHFQLTTGISFPEGLMTACTLPITSQTLQTSIATYEPSPLIVSKSPSLRMIRCNRCWPLYLNSTTSIGRSSPGEQGDKTILESYNSMKRMADSIKGGGFIENCKNVFVLHSHVPSRPYRIDTNIQRKKWF